MIEGAAHSVDNLDPAEVKIAKVLLKNNKLSMDQLNDFLKERERFEENGKRYLGDILVERGFIKKESLDQFFSENNTLYIDFCKRMMLDGFISESQHEKIMNHEATKTNLIVAIEKLGVMTKDNFIQLFSKRVNSLRLGDWLLTTRKVSDEQLQEALKEQNIYRLEDFLTYKNIVSKEIINQIKEKLQIS